MGYKVSVWSGLITMNGIVRSTRCNVEQIKEQLTVKLKQHVQPWSYVYGMS